MIVERSGITTKLLVRVPSGVQAEVAVVNRPEKSIICFSTQVGCNVGCRFCVSSLLPLKGALTRRDMIEMIYAALDYVPWDAPLILSAMGEGEPAYNYREVVATLAHFYDERPHLKLALSTSAPRRRILLRLLEEIRASGLPVKLQYSLHAANMTTRKTLIPRTYYPSYAALRDIQLHSVFARHQHPEFNVVLLEGVNDSSVDALELVSLLADYSGAYTLKVNAFNQTPQTPYRPSPPERRAAFLDILHKAGVPVEEYTTDGGDIQAACGQLHYKETQHE